MEKHSTVAIESGARQRDERMWEYGDVAAYLGVSLATVREMKRSKGLPFKRVGRAVRFRQEEIDQWVDDQQEQAA